MAAKRRVVVAGAGFAGLNVARRLQGEADVTLVAPQDFVYLPLVHEVLSERVNPPEVTVPLAAALPKARHVRAKAAAAEGKAVVTDAGERIPFDTLVVAIGAEPAFYGVPGAAEHALPFWGVADALRANAALKNAAAGAREHGQPVRVIVAGASFTGVEVAAEAADLLDDLGARREIVLLDALSEIFPRQSARFRQEVRRALKRRDLTVFTGCRIDEVRPGAVHFTSGEKEETLRSDVTFWCAGARPRRLDGVDPAVRPTLQSVEREDVFVLGDAAKFPPEMNVPLLAQTAEQEARVVAWNVLHPDDLRAYEPEVKGIIISVGHRLAVAELASGAVLAGEVPWHVKRTLYKAKIAMTG